MIVVLCLASFWWTAVLPSASAAHGNVAAAEFSVDRSFGYLKKIASEPHPVGTLAHESVRTYLMEQLRSLGLDPQLQHGMFLQESPTGHVAVDVDNVLFRIQGTSSSKAILLVAHYDSMVTSPGAGDDGAGVAALIETGYVLSQEPRLHNDVIFLLSDGEEQGSLGAKVFLREHPWAKTVGVVLNFEARGTRGPSLMFETGKSSDWLVRELIKTAPYPYANSLMPSVYKLLPNDTDLTDFKKAGLPGLNFAFVERGTDYHSALDSLSRISKDSLEHHGSYALSMVHVLGNRDLSQASAGDEGIYFNILGKHIVRYSLTTAWILAGIVVAGCLYVCIVMYRRKTVTPGRVLLALAAIGATVVVSSLAAFAVIMLLNAVCKNRRATFDTHLYPFALAALSVAVASACILWAFRRERSANMQVAALIIWTACAVLIMAYLPGVSYVILWPLVAALIAAIVNLKPASEQLSAEKYLLLLLLSVPACILLVSTTQLMFAAFFAEDAFIPTAFIALSLAIILPQWKPLLDRKWWIIPSGFGAVAIALLVLIAVPKKYNSSEPRSDNMLYMADMDKHKAMWASLDLAPDSWTAQFFSKNSHIVQLSREFPSWYFGPGRVLSEPTELGDMAAASVDLVKDMKDESGNRIVSLRFRPKGNVPVIALRLDSKAKIDAVSIEENNSLRQPAAIMATRTGLTQYPDHEFRLRYFGLPADGAVLTIRTGSTEPLAVSLITESYELPFMPGKKISPRTDDIIQRPGIGDRTIICRSYQF